MWKDKIRAGRDFVVRHGKVAFPVIVIAAVALTVAAALNTRASDKNGDGTVQSESSPEPVEQASQEGKTQTAAGGETIPEVPLEKNEDGDMYSLMATYYNALANGDVATIHTISNFVEDTEEIRITELSKYIESYPTIEIYTKPGPEPDSYIAYVYTKVTFTGYEDQMPGLQTFYVCTDESGRLYLNEGEVGEDILDYIKTINFQDDVVELNNRVNVEFNELCLSNPKLFEYINELETEVSKATGEALAAQITEGGDGQEGAPAEGQPETPGEGTPEAPAGEQPEAPTEQQPEAPPAQQPAGPQYAQATTTVNVRASDSEQADKLGKLPGGEQVQVTEQRANGWSKIVFEGKDGYVKSEYLQTVETPAGGETAPAGDGGASIGTVTANSNVNVRASASETSEKIGVVPGGESVELLARENGWCKIRHNGQVGYVKEDYVQ